MLLLALAKDPSILETRPLESSFLTGLKYKEGKGKLSLLEPRMHHFYGYGRTRQLLMLKQSSQHLSSVQSSL